MKLNYLSRNENIQLNENKLDFSDFEITKSELPYTQDVYICVSYAWEKLGAKHPYNQGIKISERTLPVLQTAYDSYQTLLRNNEKGIQITEKIWIDSLCIPLNNYEKELHYSLMGEIYAKSSLVIVILSSALESVLTKIRNSIQLTEEDFDILNKDKWVSRQWTYQEIVNSGKIYFNTEKSREKPIFASDFFNRIAKDIESFIKKNNINTLDFQKKYIFLTSLEAVILDWKIMEYQERSVYQVMVNMEYRTSDYMSSKIKAMFGCISSQLDIEHLKSNDDYSTFIELCKKKADYSFIFNTSLNRNTTKERWKPLLYDFEPIYSWLYCFGEGQKGKLKGKYLELEGIILKTEEKVREESLNFLNNILKKKTTGNLVDTIKQNLKELNFKGDYTPIELDNGFYFNQTKLVMKENYFIGISSGVKWTFGAPAMLLKKNEQTDDTFDFLSSGVFFGELNKKVNSLNAIKIN